MLTWLSNINSFSWLIVTRSNSHSRPVIRKRRGTLIYRSVANGTAIAAGVAYFNYCTAQREDDLKLGCAKSPLRPQCGLTQPGILLMPSRHRTDCDPDDALDIFGCRVEWDSKPISNSADCLQALPPWILPHGLQQSLSKSFEKPLSTIRNT